MIEINQLTCLQQPTMMKMLYYCFEPQ